MNKLGVIVPYRNRYEQLIEFKEKITEYLEDKNISYEIIIVEQDNAKLFNRGMLLNIGFMYAKSLKCDYVVFHDIDMLPINVDYSYCEHPIHLSESNPVFDEYFGGATMFPVNDFIKINGYSNKYWGWGFEDDDLLLRCKKKGIELDEYYIKNVGEQGISLKFNGIDSYVKGKNNINLNENLTIFVSFYPKEILCDHTKESDMYTVFSIPGYDFSISYNSFARYGFCSFDDQKNVLYINSNIKKNYKTNITITIDEKIKMYQDGDFIGEIDKPNNFFPYENEEFFYIGSGNPNRQGDPNFYRGYFDKLAIFRKVLSEDEISLINNGYDITRISDLMLYYDTKKIKDYKLIDLSKNNNDGIIVNCEIINLKFDEFKVIKIPFRRRSKFKLLPHEENGFVGNKWKDQSIRWNQLRFINEVSKNDELLENDGLSDLKFIEYGKTKIKKITHINVGI